VIGFFARSISRKILVSLVGIYLVTYLATALVIYTGVRSSMLDTQKMALNQLADLKYDKLAGVLGELAKDVTAWSKLEVMNDLVSGDIDKRVTRTLEGLTALYGLTGEIYAFDAAQKLLASSNEALSNNAGGAIPMPQGWLTKERGLVLLPKHANPMGGGEIVAMTIPVFGSFAENYRIGTLVLTYPWKTVEKILFSVEVRTVLLETGTHPQILATDPPEVAHLAGLDPGDAANSAYVIGRSAARPGFIGQWQVVILQEARKVTHSLRNVAVKLALLGVMLGIPIIALGHWLSSRLTAPVVELTHIVSEITETNKFDARAPISTADELGTLARSFNSMTANLERTTAERERFVLDLEALNHTLEAKVAARTAALESAVRAQQRLIGDISHEIKSPLARLSVAVELGRRSSASGTPKQFDRMEREVANIAALANELLTLARLDIGAASIKFEPVNLSDLVERIMSDAVYEAQNRYSDVTLQKPDAPIIVGGNEELLRRAIENIVRNAVFYTSAGVPIEITLSHAGPGFATIEIRDQGPGVPAEALIHLFEPFYRVDEARARQTGGTGIGLAICQRVIELHGGSIRAGNNEPHGLAVKIELPSAA